MAAAVPFIPLISAVVGGGASLLAASKASKAASKQAVPLPTITPRSNSVVSDALSARRGSAANQRTGSGGVESSTGKKSFMGQ